MAQNLYFRLQWAVGNETLDSAYKLPSLFVDIAFISCDPNSCVSETNFRSTYFIYLPDFPFQIMFIPPEGVYFRLVGRESGYKIYSRDDDPEPHLWHYGGPPYEDQLFSLIHGTGKRAGLYAIKGKVSGKVIFSRTAQTPYVGHIGGDGHYNDNWFTFEEGTGQYQNQFRILCPATGVVLYSRKHNAPEFANYTKDEVYPDQYWSFVVEPIVPFQPYTTSVPYTPEIYIPPPGLYFRLYNHVSGHVLFSRNTQEPQVWHYNILKYNDQFFSLLKGSGNREGLYAIKGKASGKVLFSRTTTQWHVGHIGGDGQYNDNWFKFLAGPSTGNHANHFRIWCPASGVAIFSRTTQKPEVGNYGPVANDQYFSFQFDNDANGLVVERIDFDVSQGKILGEVTMILGTQTATNTSQNQTKEPTFSFSEAAPASSNFEYRSGFPLDAGWVLKTGIPAVSNGAIVIDSTVNDRKFGTPNNDTKTYTTSFKGKVDPGNKAIATLSVQRAMLEVPYTIHLKSKSGVRTETMGLWSGMSTWGLKHDVREEQIQKT